jgi:hypothetical protein
MYIVKNYLQLLPRYKFCIHFDQKNGGDFLQRRLVTLLIR